MAPASSSISGDGFGSCLEGTKTPSTRLPKETEIRSGTIHSESYTEWAVEVISFPLRGNDLCKCEARYLSNLRVLTEKNLRLLPTAEVKNQKNSHSHNPPFRCSADVKAPLHTRVAPPSAGCLLQRFLPWPVGSLPVAEGIAERQLRP